MQGDDDAPPALEHWRQAVRAYGWVSCPVVFGEMHEFVKDNPMVAARDPALTRSLALGVPHPQYGVMRASMHVTPATSLTRLTAIVHRITSHEFAVSQLPHIYVGQREFRDVVHGSERVVLGIIAFCGVSGEVEYAPLSLVAWQDMWLPYFEDVNDWVMTGWNTIGWVAAIFKPFGWGGPLAVSNPHRRNGSTASVNGRNDIEIEIDDVSAGHSRS